MLFWPIAAILTLLVTAATVLPLFRRAPAGASASGPNDADVYRSQLRELEEDRARGLIGEEDARTARAEIARRLIRSANAPSPSPTSRRLSAAGAAGLAVALLLPVGTALFYDRAGSPEMPDLPLAARMPDAEPPAEVAELIGRVEARLRAVPDDAAGWALIAPIYLRLGEADKAVQAFERAIALNGASAQAFAGLGEALVQRADGRVTPDAQAQFEKALALDARWSPARFFLALKLSQEGRVAEALPAWEELLRTGEPDAPWRPIAEAARSDAREKLGTGVRGPDAADIAAAAELSQAERTAMVDGMVASLSDRLQNAPNDVEGWKRLIRSHLVLGDDAAAARALTGALASFPEGSSERAEIGALARDLGLPAPGTDAP